MGITFTNNWKNISDKLRSTFRTEFKGALPVYINDEPVSTGGQFLQLDLAGTELSEKMLGCELREYSVNLNYIFQNPNMKKSSLDNVLRYVSRIEQLMQNNTSLTLTDSTTAVNCRVNSTALEEGVDSYLVSFDWKCQHLSGLSEVINTTRVIPNAYSLDFDGSDDYVALASETNISGDWSFSAWVAPLATTYEGILASKSSNYTMITIKSSTDLRVRLHQPSSSYRYVDWDTGLTAIPTDGSWTHIVITKSGTTLTPYYNGIKGATGTLSGSDGILKAQMLGGSNADNTFENKFAGNIDEVAVWDAALDADAVKTIYNLGSPTDLRINHGSYDEYTDNLKGYWRMGDGTLDTYSLIADQVNPTLGSDIAGDLTWETDASNPLETLTSSGNAVTEAANTTGWGIGCTTGFSLTSGVVYELTFNFTLNSGAVPNKVLIAVNTSLGSLQRFIITGVDNGLQTHYFSVDSTRSDWRFGVRENSATNWSISDLSIKPVNGNAGLMTNMASDDIEEDTP